MPIPAVNNSMTWNEFKLAFPDKNYTNPHDDAIHKDAFEKNKQIIHEYNNLNPPRSSKLAVNWMTDLTDAEYETYCKGGVIHQKFNYFPKEEAVHRVKRDKTATTTGVPNANAQQLANILQQGLPVAKLKAAKSNKTTKSSNLNKAPNASPPSTAQVLPSQQQSQTLNSTSTQSGSPNHPPPSVPLSHKNKKQKSSSTTSSRSPIPAKPPKFTGTPAKPANPSPANPPPPPTNSPPPSPTRTPPSLPNQSSTNTGSPSASSQKSQSSSLPNSSQPSTPPNTVGQPLAQIQKKAAVTVLSKYLSHKSNQNIPNELNWADQGFIGDVKNQGLGCGSCWAHTAAKMAEALYFKATGNFLNFSGQYVVDCDIHETNGHKNKGCGGGNPIGAFKYIRDNGIALESSYPMAYDNQPLPYAVQNTCTAHKLNDIVRLQDVMKLPTDLPFEFRAEEEIYLKVGVAKYGPLIVLIFANLPSFQNYSGSHVYADVACRELQKGESGHWMLLIGYGTDPVDGDFWWLINS
ncbi:papain family cysteine protease domain-containing protein [Ditylenchus destructor]|nr:papain family cysteine protease domain-containing protein [Ditylenchus destructor]